MLTASSSLTTPYCALATTSLSEIYLPRAEWGLSFLFMILDFAALLLLLGATAAVSFSPRFTHTHITVTVLPVQERVSSYCTHFKFETHQVPPVFTFGRSSLKGNTVGIGLRQEITWCFLRSSRPSPGADCVVLCSVISVRRPIGVSAVFRLGQGLVWRGKLRAAGIQGSLRRLW